jgi:hypothetical protein
LQANKLYPPAETRIEAFYCERRSGPASTCCLVVLWALRCVARQMRAVGHHFVALFVIMCRPKTTEMRLADVLRAVMIMLRCGVAASDRGPGDIIDDSVNHC